MLCLHTSLPSFVLRCLITMHLCMVDWSCVDLYSELNLVTLAQKVVFALSLRSVCTQFALSLHSVCTQFALSLHSVAHFRFVSIRQVQSEQLSRTSKCLVLINLRVPVVSHNFPENRTWLKGFQHTLPTLDQSLVIMLQRFPLLAWSLLLGAGCVLLEYSCNSIWRTCLQ